MNMEEYPLLESIHKLYCNLYKVKWEHFFSVFNYVMMKNEFLALNQHNDPAYFNYQKNEFEKVLVAYGKRNLIINCILFRRAQYFRVDIAEYEGGQSIQMEVNKYIDDNNQFINLPKLITNLENKAQSSLQEIEQAPVNQKGRHYPRQTSCTQVADCLNTSDNINLQYSNDSPPLILNILINQTDYLLNERFQQSIGDINIIENGLVIVHNQTNSYASVCGFKNYSQGEHHLQFLIEHLTNNWLFIGIISSDAPIPDYPSIGKTAYGWSALDNVWHDGIRSNKLNGYVSDFKVNDYIQLIINGDKKKIHLINKRTRIGYDLHVDISHCPLPWKLNIGLFHSPGERIRIIN